MTQTNLPWAAPILVSSLKSNTPRDVALDPTPDICAALADDLGVLSIKKLRLHGTLEPANTRDWHFNGTLGATVVQACTLSLKPVTTRIDQTISRRFLAETPDYEAGSEHEMPEDDTIEPLSDIIDPGQIMAEALALALPDYPRAPDATLENAQVTEPGVAPMSDEDARPFAALAGLRDKLQKKS